MYLILIVLIQRNLSLLSIFSIDWVCGKLNLMLCINLFFFRATVQCAKRTRWGDLLPVHIADDTSSDSEKDDK